MKNADLLADAEEACFSPEEFCGFARISYDTLQRYRSRGEGPREIRIGSSVRFLRSDAIEWLRSRRVSAGVVPLQSASAE